MDNGTTNTWYQLSVNNTFSELNTTDNGLDTIEAQKRLSQYGFNEITVKRPSALLRFLRQFHNPLIYILLAAALLTGILSMRGEDMLADMSVILGVVVLNVILGFYQEGKTEAALEALRRMLVAECMVVRDGEEIIIAARELVPGDIVVLDSGDKVPADIRLFWARELYADEAPLTGESTPVRKSTNSIIKPNLPPADQSCIAFSGTFITRGSAKGIVVATGESTEFGKIAKLVKETKHVATPLQKKIADFTKILMISILTLGALNMVLGYFVGFDIVYSFLASVSLVVAAIPEMLPMLVTAILALAAAAMVKRNALIRRLPAAETLGCTTVICSDKTGTLTKNEMTVTRVYASGNDYSVTGVGYNPQGDFNLAGQSIDISNGNIALIEALRAGYHCNNAKLVQQEDRYNIIGDPTEGALIVSAAKAAVTEAYNRLDEIPFESGNMYMATLHSRKEDNIIYVKGSPERILAMCSHYLGKDGIGALQNAESEKILTRSSEMAKIALRLIGMAYKIVPNDKTWLEPGDMTGLTFLGLQGMIDPPREEAIEAISKCKSAGIRPVMITGDHVMTAKAVSQQLGILKNIEDSAVTGEELSRMNDDDLYEAVRKISVYARVAPEHKLRITQQLQRLGEIVAMTGDGVNDAPALKSADIGVAMGITGTEVSKEASDMVLTDDNFASIVGAVEEGRHAWNNLEKAILYTLPTNGGQALLIMGALLAAPFIALFAMRLPLEPIQILWVNLFDSVFLTMPLMMEPKDKGLLDQPPRCPTAKIANGLFFQRVGLVSIVMAAMGFMTYWFFGHEALATENILLTEAQTAALMSVVMVHLGYVFTARSIYGTAFKINPFSNKWLIAGVAITLIVNLMIVYAPFMQSVFRTAAFPVSWWPFILLGIPVGFLIIELEKFLRKLSGKK